jgi:protein gp37
MSLNSSIEWTDATWNPVRGCTKISPGCKHCYAETFAERFRGVKGHPYEQGFDLRLVPEKLTERFTWRSPKLVFVDSMSDLFQPGVPDEYAEAVSQVMVKANWHTYQVLTKRSERLRDLLNGRLRFAEGQRHIWWGVSVEDRKYGLPRIDDLRDSPVTVRFLSVEPLPGRLGESEFRRHRLGDCWRRKRAWGKAHQKRMGTFNSRAMPRGASSILFQTMGRQAKIA